jgi:hypothetical protein
VEGRGRIVKHEGRLDSRCPDRVSNRELGYDTEAAKIFESLRF